VPHKRLDPVFHFPVFDMKKSPDARLAGIRTLLVGISAAVLSMAAAAESIVTGGKTGTYYAIGSNLRDFVNPTLEVKDSKGSWANVEDMSQTRGVTLAIVQSDVYSAFVRMRDASDVPQATRREYAQLLANLRVFMPLYQEEIHFLVRKDEPIEFIHQIRGKPIWMDMEKSGTYLTALNVYSKLFQERPNVVQPFINTTATGDDEGTKRRRSALMALSDPAYYQAYPKIDVMVLVGGQPLGLLEKNVPANLKLLKFDPTQANSDKILQEYRKADIRKSSYPLLNMAEQRFPLAGRRFLPDHGQFRRPPEESVHPGFRWPVLREIRGFAGPRARQVAVTDLATRLRTAAPGRRLAILRQSQGAPGPLPVRLRRQTRPQRL
jgi:TRAP-type uncharacterized transport system substrate-binding protein